MKTKLLVICPTFMRPDHVEEMLVTFDATKSPGTEMFVYVSESDPKIKQYRKVLRDRNYFTGPRAYMTEVINKACFELYPETPYYQILCDDYRYRTKEWDTVLTRELEERNKGWGWVCGRDLINNDNWYKYEHPCAEVFSWKFIKTMGYTYPPYFKQFGMDHFTKEINHSIPGGRNLFVKEVIIEHLLKKISEMDDTGKISYSEEMQQQGRDAFKTWMETERDIIVKKLTDAMELE